MYTNGSRQDEHFVELLIFYRKKINGLEFYLRWNVCHPDATNCPMGLLFQKNVLGNTEWGEWLGEWVNSGRDPPRIFQKKTQLGARCGFFPTISMLSGAANKTLQPWDILVFKARHWAE